MTMTTDQAKENYTEKSEAVLNRFYTLTQSSLPIDHDPYKLIAEELGIHREEAYAFMQEARKDGSIRRVGPIFDSYKLGYVSTLCAMKVPEESIEDVAAVINRYHNVTHNYLRADLYNIWFTVIAFGDDERERIISVIEADTGLPVLQLPALKLFKIKVDFNMTDEKRDTYQGQMTVPKKVVPHALTETDKQIVRVIQENRFEGYFPFVSIAESIANALQSPFLEDELLATLKEWKNLGVIRRFGITLRHQNVGISSNAMVVWDVPAEMTSIAGKIMAEQDEVSHCYERPRYPDWPANLYTMIHGRTLEDNEEVVARIRNGLRDAGIIVAEPKLLHTLEELKKISMKYFCEEQR